MRRLRARRRSRTVPTAITPCGPPWPGPVDLLSEAEQELVPPAGRVPHQFHPGGGRAVAAPVMTR